MIDNIMFGITIAGMVLWVGSYAYQAYNIHKERVIDKQIAEGVVPRNYSKAVRERAKAGNNVVLGGTISHEQELAFQNLGSIRLQVARIRCDGFDRARLAKENGELFIDAIETNPHPKGSGAAQQWARGFCQEGGNPPAGWMEIA